MRKPTGNTYYFTSVQDIAEQLTEDQIEPFLHDLGTWLHLAKGNYEVNEKVKMITDMIKATAKLQGLDPEKVIWQDNSRFIWIDDGKTEVQDITLTRVKTP